MAVEVVMPSLAAGMADATLGRWLKTEGDAVTRGEAIAEIETDKAVMELEAEAAGRLGRILVTDGTPGVAVNTPLAVLLEADEDDSALEAYDRTPAPAGEPAEPPAGKHSDSPPPAAGTTPVADTPAAMDGERHRISPLARRLAAEWGVDLEGVAGSGPRGRIVKVDVERAREAPPGRAAWETPAAAVEPRPDESERAEVVPHTGMRRTIAARLSESKQTVPHFYLTVDVGMEALLDLRRTLNADEDASVRLSINDFVLYAVARALRRVPEVNARWSDDAVLRLHDVHIAAAVATDAGLVTPVIREADRKGLAEIAAELRHLAERARAGRLAPDTYRGGTFTVSNLGMYGIREFGAIINPPQAAILAVGAVEERPVVTDGELRAGRVMTLTLSADHRVVDGAVGARFLQTLRGLLERPMMLLV